jgi:2-methylcitrate dehydratase PrpD
MQAHTEGSPILPVQVAFNARAALHACELATLGFSPAREVFEGPYGYLAVFEGVFDLATVLDGLGREWRITQFSHKPFPAGRATHGGIEGVAALQAEHGFTTTGVERIEVHAPPLIVRLVGRPPQPEAGASYARLCLAYAVARVVQKGALDLADFRGLALAEPATQALAARVQTLNDGNPDPNALAPQRVNVHLKNGRVLSWRCETMLANPARPLTRAQQLAKFHRCLEFAAEPLQADAAPRLIEAVDRLEEIEDVRDLAALAAARSR